MNVNKSCVKLAGKGCSGKDGKSTTRSYNKKQVAKFEKFIKAQYRVHWLMDNLPAATKLFLSDHSERYAHGFPLGYVDPEKKRVYLFNHIIIIGKVHKVDEDTYRIVGFEVKTAKGRISGPQRIQNERIRRACGRAVVVRSVADVRVVLERIDREADDECLRGT